MRRSLPLLALLLLSGCASLGHQFRHLAGSRADRLADDVTIERDEWGVPHVHGRSEAAALFGLAYAMAEDNYWQIEEDYIRHLGWAAHYYGERYLADDLLRAALDVESAARAAWDRQPPELKLLWAAFAQGLDYYLATHPATPRRLIARYEPWMVFARAHTEASATGALAGVPLAEIAATAGAPAGGAAAVPDVPARSAGALVPGTRSESGRALLLGVLAAPFFGSGQLYEASFTTDQGESFAGAAVLGLPLFRAGHNGAAAWVLTATGAAEPRARRIVFDDSLAYRYEDAAYRAHWRVDTLQVNSADGVVARTYRFRATPHGVVFATRGDTALVVQLEARDALAEGRNLLKATSLATFRSALPRSAAALYADTAGELAVLGADTLPAAGAANVAALARLAFRAVPAEAAPEVAALVDEWERIGGTNPQRAFALDSAVERLRAWAGAPRGDAPETALFRLWQEELALPGYGQAFGRFRALEAVLARLERELRGDAAPGAARLQRRHTSGTEAFGDSLPSVAVSHPLHTVRGADGRRYAVSGAAWVGVFELGVPPRLASIVPFGQSADAASPHWFDQAERYARGELRPAGAVRERYRPGQRARGVHAETAAPRWP